MNLFNIIVVGLKEIWAHKFRSLLTMLGIILGVSSLVAMSALVAGMEKGLTEALVAYGGLEKIRVDQQTQLPVYQRHLQDRATGVTLNDVHALQASAPLVHTVTPSIDLAGYGSRTVISYKGRLARANSLCGTWPSAVEINEHIVEHGRLFNEIDNDEARSVCVIGTGIRDQLFGDPELIGEEIVPLGETIHINGQPFAIIGMFKHYETEQARQERVARIEQAKQAKDQLGPTVSRREKGGHYVFRLKNNTIYIPLNTMLVKFESKGGLINLAEKRLTTLFMKLHDVSSLDRALQQVRNILLLTHDGIEDFSFRTDEDWAEEITTSIRNARMSGGIIAAMALIVGGIGIMNIMLASISERIREIGIRKSIGATPHDVFLQILVESVVIAVLGGLTGLVSSIALVHSLASFTSPDNRPIITAGALILGFACSVLTGIAAGMFPAFKAANLDPIQALKYD